MHQNYLVKASLLLIAIYSFSITSFSQNKRAVIPKQLQAVGQFSQTQGSPPIASESSNKTTTLNPVNLGESPNAFSSLVPMNNTLYADDSTGLLIFIHRNSPTVTGTGTAFHLRYDISTDAGLTWANDVGPLNPITGNGRYPQIAGYEASGASSPLAGRAIYIADNYVAPAWTGINYGNSELITSGTPVTQDTLLATSTLLSTGGLTKGLSGEYWFSRLGHDGSNLTDTLFIFKGIYSPGSQLISWALHDFKIMPWYTAATGDPQALAPTMAFSPDGMTGWIGTLGDIVGGADSSLMPILIKSTDGGATWGSPAEVDLNSFPWVADSLMALWLDTAGTPVSTGRATAAFEFDLTVDANGNPHMFFVMGSATTIFNPSGYPYSIYAGLAKYAVDLSSSNQGLNYELRNVAPVLTFRTSSSVAVPESQDNYPQVSRSSDGQYIFYSWVDSDTTVIGFGESENLQPNLYVAGLRMVDGFSTCHHPVTAGDVNWDGFAYSPQMASEVFKTGSGMSSSYHLPIAMTRSAPGTFIDPCSNYYFGNEIELTEGDFAYPPGSRSNWFGCTVNPNVAAFINGKVYGDMNSNGQFDAGDIPIPGKLVETSPLNYGALTDVSGNFYLQCTAGFTYGLTTMPLTAMAWTVSQPSAPYNLSLLTPGMALTGNDFGFAPISGAEDFAVEVLIGSLKIGQTQYEHIYVNNLGTLPSTSVLTLQYDSLVQLVSANPAYTSINTTTHTATWNLASIPVFGSQDIVLGLEPIISAGIGTNVNFTASISIPNTDWQPANDVDFSNSTLVASYDPNDKQVMPAGDGANHVVMPGSFLSYRIRFQNTGTAPATNVVLRDTLDASINLHSLRMLGASHNYNLRLEPGRVLVWEFLNIMLPDSGSNEPASHGYVDFMVYPNVGLPYGTVVENSAGIYFDANAPVQTNTAWITYDISTEAQFSDLPRLAIRVYPNPMEAFATIELQRHNGKPWSFELYDLNGRKLFAEEGILGNRYDLQRQAWPAGTYIYKASSLGSLPKTGKLILQ